LSSGHQTCQFAVKTFNNISRDSPASVKEYANLDSAHITTHEEENKILIALKAENDYLKSALEAVKKELNSPKVSSGRSKQPRQ
jgi:hypothetical protein